jgi:hypothetical protein
MDQDSGAVNPEPRTGAGVDRRTLIKASAIAGLGAWTAPLIIDSLSSPAAAITPVAGCFKVEFDWNGSEWINNPSPTTALCEPVGWSTCTASTSDALGITKLSGPNQSNQQFSIAAGCRLTTGRARQTTEADGTGTATCTTEVGGSTSISIQKGAGNVFLQNIYLRVTCP